jgi:alkyl-hydroperoxide reductase/thiol specific antioxidant family protein
VLQILGDNRSSIEATGTQLAFIHPVPEAEAEPYFRKYGLADLPRVSDPRGDSYRAFKLERMRPTDFLKPKAIWRAFQTAVLKRQGFGATSGDEFQLPGAFVVHKGVIEKSYFYKQPWEHPDFLEMATSL